MNMGEVEKTPPENGDTEITKSLFPQPDKSDKDANASVGASIVNMANNMMGSGFVVLAYAIKEVGILNGSQLSVL